MPTDSPAWTTDLVLGDHFIFGTSSPAAQAGYPIINVPMSGFEAATKARIKPQFLPALPTDQAAPQRKGKGPKAPHPRPMAMRI